MVQGPLLRVLGLGFSGSVFRGQDLVLRISVQRWLLVQVLRIRLLRSGSRVWGLVLGIRVQGLGVVLWGGRGGQQHTFAILYEMCFDLKDFWR